MNNNIMSSIKPFLLAENDREVFPDNYIMEQMLFSWLRENELTQQQLVRFMLIGFFPDYRACVHIGIEFNTAEEDNENLDPVLRKKNELFNTYFGKEITSTAEYIKALQLQEVPEYSGEIFFNYIIDGKKIPGKTFIENSFSTGFPIDDENKETVALYQDRLKGAVFGLCIGDSLGAFSEGLHPVNARRLAENHGIWPAAFVDSKKFKKGEPTDDSEMAILIYDSFLACNRFNADDLAKRFALWAAGVPKDIGTTTRYVLNRVLEGKSWEKASRDYFNFQPGSIANGALMRNGIIPVLYFNKSLRTIFIYSLLQGMITHYNISSLIPCLIQSYFIYNIIRQKEMDIPGWIAEALFLAECLFLEIEEPKENGYLGPLAAEQNWRGVIKDLSDYLTSGIKSFNPYSYNYRNKSGYAWLSLLISLWSLQFNDFNEGIQGVVKIGADADTYGAISGPLLGALYGYSSIAKNYISDLQVKDKIEGVYDQLIKIPSDNPATTKALSVEEVNDLINSIKKY